MPNPWGWTQIKQLLDEVAPLTTDRKSPDSFEGTSRLAFRLFGFIPQSKAELRRLRDNAKRYFRLATSRRPETREILMPYRRELRALVWSTRQRLATAIAAVNPHGWDKRAWGLFHALQANLGKMPRTYFLTVTFRKHATYEQVRKKLKGIVGNILGRAGFESVDVVAWHPKRGSDARIHAHLIFWNVRPRSRQAESAAVKRVDAALKAGRYGAGSCPLSKTRDFLSTAAYLAFNYDRMLKLAKGPSNPIPKYAKLLRPPKQVLPGRPWTKTGRFSFVTPATKAWRAAVARYAVATGKDENGCWRWIWRERHRIRAYLQPEEWCSVCVTGLDGYTYQVASYGVDHLGNETYLVSNEERGGFVLTDRGLEVVAGYQASFNALPKNDRLDLTTGQRANWREVWGMPFQRRRNQRRVPMPRRNPVSTPRRYRRGCAGQKLAGTANTC